MATIQQIAELAGVSRGTVDRALNGRGRVNSEVEARIKKIADDLGYVPKHQMRSVAAGDERNKKIGIITQLAGASFMLEVDRGIEDARRELAERGIAVFVKRCNSVDETEQIQALEELETEGIDGLAIMPVESNRVRERLNTLAEQGIPSITFNSDIVGTRRSCYVGLDNRKSGQTAAALMGLMTRGTGKLLIITGVFSNSVSSQRVDGFIETMKREFPDMELAGVQTSFDKAKEVENIILNAMHTFPDLAGIFVVSGGQAGVENAFCKLDIKKRPYVIIYDLTPENERALREKVVDFLIDQEGYEQGYRPPFLLADKIWKGVEADREFMYTEISIRNRYNL